MLENEFRVIGKLISYFRNYQGKKVSLITYLCRATLGAGNGEIYEKNN